MRTFYLIKIILKDILKTNALYKNIRRRLKNGKTSLTDAEMRYCVNDSLAVIAYLQNMEGVE